MSDEQEEGRRAAVAADPPPPVRILAISGSLRQGSSNTAVLEAAALVASPRVTIELYPGLGALPPFNPDLDTGDDDSLPAPAAALRTAIGRADAVLISSPEYAHGMAGALKNLLDWLVGSIEFPGKPVALINTSPMSVHATAQLMEVLVTMNARVVQAACATVPLRGGRLNAPEIAADPELSPALRAAVGELAAAARAARGLTPG